MHGLSPSFTSPCTTSLMACEGGCSTSTNSDEAVSRSSSLEIEMVFTMLTLSPSSTSPCITFLLACEGGCSTSTNSDGAVSRSSSVETEMALTMHELSTSSTSTCTTSLLAFEGGCSTSTNSDEAVSISSFKLGMALTVLLSWSSFISNSTASTFSCEAACSTLTNSDDTVSRSSSIESGMTVLSSWSSLSLCIKPSVFSKLDTSSSTLGSSSLPLVHTNSIWPPFLSSWWKFSGIEFSSNCSPNCSVLSNSTAMSWQDSNSSGLVETNSSSFFSINPSFSCWPLNPEWSSFLTSSNFSSAGSSEVFLSSSTCEISLKMTRSVTDNKVPSLISSAIITSPFCWDSFCCDSSIAASWLLSVMFSTLFCPVESTQICELSNSVSHLTFWLTDSSCTSSTGESSFITISSESSLRFSKTLSTRSSASKLDAISSWWLKKLTTLISSSILSFSTSSEVSEALSSTKFSERRLLAIDSPLPTSITSLFSALIPPCTSSIFVPFSSLLVSFSITVTEHSSSSSTLYNIWTLSSGSSTPSTGWNSLQTPSFEASSTLTSIGSENSPTSFFPSGGIEEMSSSSLISSTIISRLSRGSAMSFSKFMFPGWITRGLEATPFSWMPILSTKPFSTLLNSLSSEACSNTICPFELSNSLVFRLSLLEVCSSKETKNCEDLFDSWFSDDATLEVSLSSGAKNCDSCALFVGDFGTKTDPSFAGWLTIFFTLLTLMFLFT